MKKSLQWFILSKVLCFIFFETHAQGLTEFQLAYSPVANVIATVYDNKLSILDATTIRVINSLVLDNAISAFAWNTTGTQIVFGTGINVYIWTNPLDGQATTALEDTYPSDVDLRYTSSVGSFSWNDSNSKIAASVSGALIIWDTTSFKIVTQIKNDWSTIYQVKWLSDTSIAIANQDSHVYVVDVETNTILKTLWIYDDTINPFYSLDFNADSTQMFASWDEGYIVFWNFEETPEAFTEGSDFVLDHNIGEGHYVSSLDWSPNDLYIATGSTSGTAKIWNAQTGEIIKTLHVSSPDTSVVVSWNFDGSTLAYGAEDSPVPRFIETVSLLDD